MSHSDIINCINEIPKITNWDAHLINYNHNASNVRFNCFDLNFKDRESLKALIIEMANTFNILIDKNNKDFRDYTGSNPKNSIDTIRLSDNIISEQWSLLLASLSSSDDVTELKNIKAKAFIFIGKYKDDNNEDKRIYILCRKNPIFNAKRSKNIFTSINNEVTSSKTPLLQFQKCADVIIFEDTLYAINLNFESIFNIEYSHKRACNNHLNRLKDLNIIKDFEKFEAISKFNQNPKKFINFNEAIFKKLENKESLKSIAKKLSLPTHTSGNDVFLDLSSSDNAIKFINLICNRTKRNVENESLCLVDNPTPLR